MQLRAKQRHGRLRRQLLCLVMLSQTEQAGGVRQVGGRLSPAALVHPGQFLSIPFQMVLFLKGSVLL